MKLEHVALNVAEPLAVAEWYEAHVGLSVVRRMASTPYTHFLADSSGSVLVEIYRNPPDQVPAYAEMDPLLLHLAFVSADPASDKDRLVAAGPALPVGQHGRHCCRGRVHNHRAQLPPGAA